MVKQLLKMIAVGGIVTGFLVSPASALGQPNSIIFTSNRDGETEVYAAARNGDNLQRLTDNDIDEQEVAASSDGSKIAFVSLGESGFDSSISILDIKSGNIKRILDSPGISYQSPAWSHDGKYIAYSIFTISDSKWLSCIAIFKVSTGNSNKVSCSNNLLMSPAWSPNNKIIFTELTREAEPSLYTVNPFNDEEKEYLHAGALGVFSPDGNKVAYSAQDSNAVNQIFTMNLDGSDIRQITSGDDFHTIVDWAKDGYITYLNISSNPVQFQAKSLRPDGSGELVIPQKRLGIVDQPGKGLLIN